MLEFKFRVPETTRKGKLLKDLFKDDNVQDCRISIAKVCLECHNKVDDESKVVKCFMCQNKFHTSCLNTPLSADCLSMLAANPCLWWFCSNCTKTSETTSDEASSAGSDTPTQVDFMNAINEQFSVLKNELFLTMNETIDKKLSSIADKANVDEASKPVLPYSAHFTSASATNCPPTPPQVQQPATSASAEILSVTPNTNSVNANTMAHVKRFVTDSLKTVPVEFISANENSKKISIGFRDSATREKAQALVTADNVLKDYGYSSQKSNKMLPKVTISNVSCEILEVDGTAVDYTGKNDEEIREHKKQLIVSRILEKNPSVKILSDDGHTLQVVYMNLVKHHVPRGNSESLTLGLKVSPSIYQVMFQQQSGTIYLGNRRYKVFDRFYIKQCYHCQMIGHTSKDCQDAKADKLPKCMYCAQEHRSTNCPTKGNTANHACARCLASSTGNAQDARNHNAGSNLCPLIVKESKRLATYTDFTSKNVC